MIPEMPQAPNSERAVIGSILFSPEYLKEIVDSLFPDHFYDQKLAHVYETMVTCYRRRIRPDLSVLPDLLSRDIVGDSPLMFLINLSSAHFLPAHIEGYAREVMDAASLRAVIMAAAKIAKIAYDGRDNVTEALDLAEQELLKATRVGRRSDDFTSIGQLANEYYETINSDEDNDEIACKTGFTDIDQQLNGGLRRGEFIIIGARPATGKTSLAVQIASNVGIDQVKKVGFFEMEMDKKQLHQRALALRTKIGLTEVQGRRFYNESDLHTVTLDTAAMQTGFLDIDHTAALTLAEIRSRSRSLMVRWGGLDLIIIDYLQLMRGRSGGKTSSERIQDISEISRGLKQLARELNVPIIALSQLSRAVEGRADHVPMLSDLRESGSLEQDADQVWFIYREELYDKETDKKGVAEIHIAKHRNGPTGVVPLRFESGLTRFDNLERYRTPEGY